MVTRKHQDKKAIKTWRMPLNAGKADLRSPRLNRQHWLDTKVGFAYDWPCRDNFHKHAYCTCNRIRSNEPRSQAWGIIEESVRQSGGTELLQLVSTRLQGN